MTSLSEMSDTFRSLLELCSLKRGETLAVLSADHQRSDHARAFLTAGRMLGANVFQLNLDGSCVSRMALSGNAAAVESLKRADLVIDLIGLLFSAEQVEITAAGARMLMVLEPYEVLRDLVPTPELRRRVEVAGKHLERASSLRVTSSAGTDVTYRLAKYPVLTEYGYTDMPGRWDHWPSGFLFTHGDDDGVDGLVVVAPGDIMARFRRYVVEPIHLYIERGRVVRVEGMGFDASLMRDYIESFHDPRAYAVSHIGWGLNDKANWHHLAITRTRDQEIGMHGLAFAGNVLFSMGPNSELGGDNDTLCHLDIPLRGCSLQLDGQLMVDAGKLVE
jgi:2,5-dihydroxypyridine 5,6-dioxygenase